MSYGRCSLFALFCVFSIVGINRVIGQETSMTVTSPPATAQEMTAKTPADDARLIPPAGRKQEASTGDRRMTAESDAGETDARREGPRLSEIRSQSPGEAGHESRFFSIAWPWA